MKVIHAVHPDDFKRYDTTTIRSRFLLDELGKEGELNFAYTHYDRMIVGMAIPTTGALELGNYPNLKADYFLQRREMGIINVGGEGTVTVDGKEYGLSKLDCLYVGKDVKEVSFASNVADKPAVFYILSAPAHASYPVTLLTKDKAESNTLGSLESSNHRTIYRYIHRNGIQSCQLVMGLTILEKGSVWNTIPPHTHDRRMEVYFYFDVPQDAVVFHYMGEPSETRHIMMKNYNAVVSPPWSIHSGSATSNYGFIWGMAGENLEYGDMDGMAVTDLK